MESLIITEADAANLALLGAPALARLLEGACIVASDAVPADIVTMNSHVVCTDAASGTRRVLSVVYPQDQDPAAGKISVLSPAGMALIGVSAGQTVEWALPEGGRGRLRVDALLHQPEQHLRTLLIVRS
jgi:regulator of nucleoside diphosphate kinase